MVLYVLVATHMHSPSIDVIADITPQLITLNQNNKIYVWLGLQMDYEIFFITI